MSASHAPESHAVDPAPSEPVSAKGINGTVAVAGDVLTIRKGLTARSSGVRGPRHIAIREVTDICLGPATDEHAGSLQIVLNGNCAGANGEHTITFAKASAGQFDQVHARVQAALKRR